MKVLHLSTGAGQEVWIQGHVADTLLSSAARGTAFFAHYWVIRGLTAPLFFVLSGFAFVVASDPRWQEYGRPGPRLLERLRRIGVLLLVGYLIQVPHWTGFPFELTSEEWRYVLRSGVLHCVAGSLVLGHLLIAVTRTRRVFTLCALVIAVGVVAATPAISASELIHRLPMPLRMWVRTEEGSLFPLFPWIAHFMLGAALARLHLDVPAFSSGRRIGALIGFAGGAMLAAGVAARMLDPGRAAAPGYWVTDPTLFLSRAGGAWCLLASAALLLGRITHSPAWMVVVSSRALSVYVAHLVALWGLPTVPGLIHRVGATLDLGAGFATGPALLILCTLAAVGWDRGRRALARWVKVI